MGVVKPARRAASQVGNPAPVDPQVRASPQGPTTQQTGKMPRSRPRRRDQPGHRYYHQHCPPPTQPQNLPLAGHAVVVAIQVWSVGGFTTVNGGAYSGRTGCCAVPEATPLRGRCRCRRRGCLNWSRGRSWRRCGSRGRGGLADWG